MRDRQHRGRQLTARIRTRATPEEVWEAWTDPEKIAHWFVDRARGRPEVGSTFTWIFKVVGARVLSWNMPEGEAPEIERRLETALERLSTALSQGAASTGPPR